MTATAVTIVGAAGRMGRELMRLVAAHPGLRLAAALERQGAPEIGQDAGSLAGLGPTGIVVTDDVDLAIQSGDVVLDFTIPVVSVGIALAAARLNRAVVCGTTGFSAAENDVFEDAAKRVAIVKSGNFSLGVNVLAALVQEAAKRLDAAFDIEIVEMHHNRKIDAPSGTALLLGEAAAEGRGIVLADHSERGRDGHTGARAKGAIGFAALRGGTVVGDHSVVFAGPSERLVLSHVAEDRALFAHGALKAVTFAAKAQPGLYSMADVLGLSRS